MEFDAVLLRPRRAESVARGCWRDRTIDDDLDACVVHCPDELALTAVVRDSGDVRPFTYRSSQRSPTTSPSVSPSSASVATTSSPILTMRRWRAASTRTCRAEKDHRSRGWRAGRFRRPADGACMGEGARRRVDPDAEPRRRHPDPARRRQPSGIHHRRLRAAGRRGEGRRPSRRLPPLLIRPVMFGWKRQK